MRTAYANIPLRWTSLTLIVESVVVAIWSAHHHTTLGYWEHTVWWFLAPLVQGYLTHWNIRLAKLEQIEDVPLDLSEV